MNDQKAAQAIRTIIIGLDELAAAFDAPEAGHAAGGELRTGETRPEIARPPAIPELPPVPLDEEEEFLADAAFPPKTLEPVGDQGFAAICPKHRVPYKDGRYGLFCSKLTDDPAWAKVRDGKSWCSITPRNAAKYLEIRAAAAA